MLLAVNIHGSQLLKLVLKMVNIYLKGLKVGNIGKKNIGNLEKNIYEYYCEFGMSMIEENVDSFWSGSVTAA